MRHELKRMHPAELIFELESEWDRVRFELKRLVETRSDDAFEQARLFGRGQVLEEVINKLRGMNETSRGN